MFGKLEAAIMAVVWDEAEPVTVRQVHEALDRPLAYTTVMSVMDNLHSKDVLTRQRAGRAYLYRARHSREEYTAMVMAGVLRSSADHGATFVQFVQQMDPAEVAELRKALEEAGPA